MADFVGKSAALQELAFFSCSLCNVINDSVESFCSRGMSGNRPIEKFDFHGIDLLGGELLQSLRPFFANGQNISLVGARPSRLGRGRARRLSSALRVCSKSLKSFALRSNQMGDEELVDIIEALSVHPQLESLEFCEASADGNERAALAALLRPASADLHALNLRRAGIGDEGVDALADALANSSAHLLDLSDDPLRVGAGVAVRGCQALAVLLENPNCNLESLAIDNDNIGDQEARAFANWLASNRKLKKLGLWSNRVTAEGWSSFSKALCDASCINDARLSNHILESFGGSRLPSGVAFSSLALSASNEDKRQVAIKKIRSAASILTCSPFLSGS